MSVRSSLYPFISTQMSISGISATFYIGRPEPLPLSDAPFSVMWLEEPRIDQMTMGNAGIMGEVYNMKVRLYLGPEDMSETDAVLAAANYADKFRYALCVPADAEATSMESYLGVFDAGIIGGSSNLETYRQSGEAPYLEYTMQITELRSANAAAS